VLFLFLSLISSCLRSFNFSSKFSVWAEFDVPVGVEFSLFGICDFCFWLVTDICCDEILEEHTKTDHQKNIPSGIRNRETLNSTDELINGVHEKVTRYILSIFYIDKTGSTERKNWDPTGK
jgi:hypothetical protein